MYSIHASSIRVQLITLFGILIILCCAGLYLIALSYGRSVANSSFDRLLAGSALSISEVLTVFEGEIDVDVPYAALDMLSTAPDDRVYYSVTLSNGQLVAGYENLPESDTGRGINVSRLPGALLAYSADFRGEETSFVVLRRIISTPDGSQLVRIQVGQTQKAREQLAREQALAALLPVIAIGVLALVVVLFTINRILRPISRISADIAGRAATELQPTTLRVPMEISELVESINEFMRRLDLSMSSLRAFVGDAAHQVRTPLAAIRAQAQASLDGSDQEMRSSLAVIERKAVNLSDLFDRMLMLATLHHRAAVRFIERFDLEEVLEEAVAKYVPSGVESNCHLLRFTQAVPMSGDPVMLEQAFKNLIENAYAHGNAQARGLYIECAVTDSERIIFFSDRGPGVPSVARQRLFERFKKGDLSLGAGLGLAISRQIIADNGGQLQLEDREGFSTTFAVRFPRPPGGVRS